MKRICVLGPPGSGKSTLARQLGELCALPVTHLDTLYWEPGWVAAPEEIFRARVAEVVARGSWVIDGNYGRTLPDRLPLADLVILLDFSRWVCVARVAMRTYKNRGRTRADLTEGCDERFNREFFREFVPWVWRWRENSFETKREMITQLCAPETAVTLRSRGEVRRFLTGIRANTPFI